MTNELLPIKVEDSINKLFKNVNKVIYGRRGTVNKIIMALIAGGHVLLEDVPGIGKTLIAKVISKSINAQFRRVQCTPDLLPSDISGVNIYDTKAGEFKFMPGPIFTNILLVDEINRAAPRTQSCLLEAMEEFQVTIDCKTYKLNKPFFVIATQNPLEYHGTFELPEAQLDRFLMLVKLGYPSREEEINVMDFYLNEQSYNIDPVISQEDYLNIHHHLIKVNVENSIKNFIMDIVKASRSCPEVKVGISTRGALALLKVAQASAIISKRNYVIPDDVLYIAESVLCHRLITYDNLDSNSKSNLIASILSGVKVPL